MVAASGQGLQWCLCSSAMVLERRCQSSCVSNSDPTSWLEYDCASGSRPILAIGAEDGTRRGTRKGQEQYEAQKDPNGDIPHPLQIPCVIVRYRQGVNPV